ncbi:MAG: hypothetical protein NTX24_02855 [Candidatus Pacearchaeota archaeon]|nr:hypothetical protein [Candidatus Pacearchaeota archaeon]
MKAKKRKTKVKKNKAAKKVAKTSKVKVKGKCGDCIFYVPNKDKKGIGSCFEISKMVKEVQSPACRGKFFKVKAK